MSLRLTLTMHFQPLHAPDHVTCQSGSAGVMCSVHIFILLC